jgi:ElaB/YqjD/DUF883 family membrane-anchored ribosome-binding protein
MNQLPEAAGKLSGMAADGIRQTTQRATVIANDAAGEVEDLAGDFAGATRDAAHRVTDKVKNLYQSAELKAGDTLAASKEYVRRNPVPVVLGAIGIGAAIGYMIIIARRKPAFSEQYVEEPLAVVREALLSALAPVSHHVHEGYESARNGMGKTMDRVHRFKPVRTFDSLSEQIARVGGNLKFW